MPMYSFKDASTRKTLDMRKFRGAYEARLYVMKHYHSILADKGVWFYKVEPPSFDSMGGEYSEGSFWYDTRYREYVWLGVGIRAKTVDPKTGKIMGNYT